MVNYKKFIKEIENIPNPYPKDVFLWNNKEGMIIKRGRFNEFVHGVYENAKQAMIKKIQEMEENENGKP